jgi:hypothetical protein
MKPYKGGKTSMVFYLPRPIADVIPPDAHFEAELTDEGVLFRFAGFEEPSKDGVPVPDWAVRQA